MPDYSYEIAERTSVYNIDFAEYKLTGSINLTIKKQGVKKCKVFN